MQLKTGITEALSDKISIVLCGLLADEFVLCTKTKNALWNVEGIDFYAKHTFFESQYRQLDDVIDNIAEHIRTISHYAPATLNEYLSLTHLSEKSREKNDSCGFIKLLLDDHLSIILHLRENIIHFAKDYKDEGTSDFITGIMKTHQKMAWMLRAHLK